jgi:polar amino acid transport system substrate-binding protein
MNKLVHHIAGLFLCVALYTETAVAFDINVVHSGNWPPYASAELPEQGLAIDLVTTALKRNGYNPQVKTASLPQILEGSKTGAYDVFATPWYTIERDQYLDFSQPYLESSINFIKRTDSPFEYAAFDDLEGMTVAVIENYAYDEDFRDAPAIKKVSAGSLTENLRKLLEKEVDLSLDDERVLRYTINRLMPHGMATLEILEKPLAVRGVNIGVSRQNPDHAKIVAGFDNAIAEMKKDGTYDRIIKKHNDYFELPVKR